MSVIRYAGMCLFDAAAPNRLHCVSHPGDHREILMQETEIASVMDEFFDRALLVGEARRMVADRFNIRDPDGVVLTGHSRNHTLKVVTVTPTP